MSLFDNILRLAAKTGSLESAAQSANLARALTANAVKAGEKVSPKLIKAIDPEIALAAQRRFAAHRDTVHAATDQLARYHNANSDELDALHQLKEANENRHVSFKGAEEHFIKDPYLNTPQIDLSDPRNLMAAFVKNPGQATAGVTKKALSSYGELYEYKAVARAAEDASGTAAEMRHVVSQAGREFDTVVRKGFYKNDFAKYEADFPVYQRVLTGELPMTALPEPVRDATQGLRDSIEFVRSKLKKSGLPNDTLAILDSTDNIWLHRSYKIHHDPVYLAEARARVSPEMAKKYQAAIDEVIANNEKNYTQWAAERGIQRGTPEYDEFVQSKAKLIIQDILDTASEKQGIIMKGPAGINKVNRRLEAFMKRADIPKALREYMGEETDPLITAMRSAGTLIDTVSNNKFLLDIYRGGNGKIIFHSPTERATEVLFTENDSLFQNMKSSPLAGMYTTPEFKAAFTKYFDRQASLGTLGTLMDAPFLRTWAGLQNRALTTWSATSALRNWSAAPFLALNSGNFWLRDFFHGESEIGKNLTKSLQASHAHFEQQALGRGETLLHGNKITDQVGSFVQLAQRHGLLDQNVSANTLVEHVSEIASSHNMAEAFDKVHNRLLEGAYDAVKKTDSAFSQAYQVPDNLLKLFVFSRELNRYADALNLPITNVELQKQVAQVVREMTPTYSRLPNATKWIKNIPALGMFVSFSTEVLRNSASTLRQAAHELKSTNPAIRKIGHERILSVMAGYGAAWGIGTAATRINGISDEEEAAVREIAPKWDKNAILNISRNEDGTYTTKNLSFLFPQAVLLDAVTATGRGMSDEGILMGTLRGFEKLFSPYLSESVGPQYLAAMLTNRDLKTGERIVEEDAPFTEHILGRTLYAMQSLKPGTVDTLGRMTKAITGEKGAYGREYNLVDETFAPFLGRPTKFNPETSIEREMYRYIKVRDQVRREYYSVVANGGSLPMGKSDADIYRQSMAALRVAQSKMYSKLEAARALGVEPGLMKRLMKQVGLSEAERKLLARGEIAPFEPSKEIVETSERRGRRIQTSLIKGVLNNEIKGQSLSH